MSGTEVPVPPPAERMATVLSALATRARRTNLDRAADLRSALRRAAVGGLDVEGWSVAEQTAHQLAGSAGTFGYRQASELARDLERWCARWGEDAAGASGPLTGPASLDSAFELLDRLTEQLSEPELD